MPSIQDGSFASVFFGLRFACSGLRLLIVLLTSVSTRIRMLFLSPPDLERGLDLATGVDPLKLDEFPSTVSQQEVLVSLSAAFVTSILGWFCLRRRNERVLKSVFFESDVGCERSPPSSPFFSILELKDNKSGSDRDNLRILVK